MVQPLDYLSLRSAKTALRLTRGAFLLTVSALGGPWRKPPAVISFDIFGTLIQRVADEHFAARASAEDTIRHARSQGLPTPVNSFSFRRRIERQLSKQRLDLNASLEIDNKTIIQAMLTALGAGATAEQDASLIAARELSHEMSCTRPRTEILAILNDFVATGQRIIAISDTRYSAGELRQLLEKNGITGIAQIYSSLDLGVSKFRGGAFDAVLRQESVRPGEIQHIGDNVVADILAASERRWRVRWVKRPPPPPALPSPPRAAVQDAAYRLGHDVLGPVLVGFVRLLFKAVHDRNINALAFMARDGYLLHEVAKTLIEHNPTAPEVSLSYVKISRRLALSSTMNFSGLAGAPEMLERLLRDIQLLRGPDNLITKFSGLFNIPAPVIETQCLRLGFVVGDADELRRLLCDAEAAAAFSAILGQSRKILLNYLNAENIFSGRTGLVDIGWQGTIHTMVGYLAESEGHEKPEAFYFGFVDNKVNPYAPSSFGLVTDSRRGRNSLETATFQLISLLEACSQADHGMVTALACDENNEITPLFVTSGAAREAELTVGPMRRRVQQGILDYASWYGQNFPIAVPDERKIRQKAHKLLLKLAYFPTRQERIVGQQFFHLEPTDDKIAIPLILPRGQGVRGWLAGLRSPWKGGYFMENGGHLVAFAYFVFSAALAYLSEEQKITIRRFLFGKHA